MAFENDKNSGSSRKREPQRISFENEEAARLGGSFVGKVYLKKPCNQEPARSAYVLTPRTRCKWNGFIINSKFMNMLGK